MKWRVKALIQKALAAMPFGIGERLNRDLPVWVGRRSYGIGARAAAIAELHAAPLAERRAGGTKSDRVLELGTGYNLFMALPFALLGYRMTTLDLSRDVTFKAARALVLSLEEQLERLAALPACRLEEQEMRTLHASLAGAMSLDELLQRAGIEYLAPYEPERFAAQRTSEFGYTTSHCVFEHIPPELFPSVLQMMKEVSGPGAIFSHQVDMRDHRSSEGFLVDARLFYLDYLTFSERSWRFWNGNRIAYTNRWRKSDYVDVLQKNGHAVEDSRDVVFEGPALPLGPGDLHPSFHHYTEDDLRVQASLIVGRVTGDRSGGAAAAS